MDITLMMLNLIAAVVFGLMAGWIFMEKRYGGAVLFMLISWVNWVAFFLAVQ